MSLQPRSDKYGSVPAALKRVIEVPADLFVNLMSPFNNDRFSAVGLAIVLMQERAYLVWSNNTCLRSQRRVNREAFDTWAICRHWSQLKNYDMLASAVSTYAVNIQVPSWQLVWGHLALHGCLLTIWKARGHIINLISVAYEYEIGNILLTNLMKSR